MLWRIVCKGGLLLIDKGGAIMHIERLDKAKIIISLCSQDMQDFCLNFEKLSFHDERSKTVMMRLLKLASVKTGIHMSGRTVVVEALPFQGGCMLLVTLLDKESARKVYRVKRLKECPAVVFSEAENLLSAAEAVYVRGACMHLNSLWMADGKYYLLMDYPYMSPMLKGILTEFGRYLPLGEAEVSRIKERGQLLVSSDALRIIGSKVQSK